MIGAQVGNYVIRELLGEGGMGAVYLAEHPTIGKKVALKLLHAELSTNQDIATRFDVRPRRKLGRCRFVKSPGEPLRDR